ncbi:MAG: YdcF family protein [Methylocystis sp.]
MFFILSKIFEFVGSPSHVALMILALGAALAYTRHVNVGRRLTTLGAALLLLMAFGPLGHMLAVPLETRFPAQPDEIDPPDGIVVLGGSVDEGLSAERGRATFNQAAERVIAPIELLRRYPKARLVFTGGSGSLTASPSSEANEVRRFWRAVGLDRGDVVYEDRSRNTFENAVFTRDLAKPRAGERWLLITSAMHMPRAVGVFRKAGFPVIAYPVDYRTNAGFWSAGVPGDTGSAIGMIETAEHEWLGLVAYRLTGKTDTLFPGP